MFIARVPIAQKKLVLDQQQEWSKAKLAWHEATQEYNQASTEVKVAENERGMAKLEEKSVKEMQKGAEKTGDLTQINEATLKMRAAKLGHKAAQKKVEYAKVRRTYLHLKMLHAEDLMYLEEARYELSKANTAQNNNIQPRGVKIANFQKQFEQRSRYAQRSKTRLDREKAKLDRLRKEWKTLEKEASVASSSATGAPPPDNNNNNHGGKTGGGNGGKGGKGSGGSSGSTTTEPIGGGGGGQ